MGMASHAATLSPSSGCSPGALPCQLRIESSPCWSSTSAVRIRPAEPVPDLVESGQWDEIGKRAGVSNVEISSIVLIEGGASGGRIIPDTSYTLSPPFPDTGPSGNGIAPNLKTQAEFLRHLKNGTCLACHQMGGKATREISPEMIAVHGPFKSTAEAWLQRGNATGADADAHVGTAVGQGRDRAVVEPRHVGGGVEERQIDVSDHEVPAVRVDPVHERPVDAVLPDHVGVPDDVQRVLAKAQYCVTDPGTATSFLLAWPVLRNFQAFQGERRTPNYDWWIDETQPPIGRT